MRVCLMWLGLMCGGCAFASALTQYPEAQRAGCDPRQESFAIDARLSDPQEKPPTAYAMISCYGQNDLGYQRHMLVWLDRQGQVLRVDTEDHVYDQLERIYRKVGE